MAIADKQRYIDFPPFTFDTELSTLENGQVIIPLEPRHFSILQCIIENHPHIARYDDVRLCDTLSAKADEEEKRRLFVKYVSELKNLMGGTEFENCITNVTKKRDKKKNIGGYKFTSAFSYRDDPIATAHPATTAPISYLSNTSEPITVADVQLSSSREHEQQTRHAQIRLSDEELSSLALPHPEATLFAAKHGCLHKRIIGQAIETHPYPYLRGTTMDRAGWAPEQVLLQVRKGMIPETVAGDPFIREAFIRGEQDRLSNGEPSLLTGNNGTKFSIVDISAIHLEDIDTLRVAVRLTNWYALNRVRDGLQTSSEKRIEYGGGDPSQSTIPQGAGIQFCALFSDDQILAIHRRPKTYPFPSTWSFSGEEAIAPLDLEWPEAERVKFALLRTCLEEVFPLARPTCAEIRRVVDIAKLEEYIGSMRIWSIFLEEPTATFQLFVVFDFNLTIGEYRTTVLDMVGRNLGDMSNEGDYYSVRLTDALNLLRGHTIKPTPLFGGPSVAIGDLHPTSRYRLCRLFSVLADASVLAERRW